MKLSILDTVMGWSTTSVEEAGSAFPNTIIAQYAGYTRSFGRLDILSRCLLEHCTYSNTVPTTYIYIDQKADIQAMMEKLPQPTSTDGVYAIYVHPSLVQQLWDFALLFHDTMTKHGYFAFIRYPENYKEESDVFGNLCKSQVLYTTNGKYADVLRVVRSQCSPYSTTL